MSKTNTDKAIKCLPVFYLIVILGAIGIAVFTHYEIKTPDRDLFNVTTLVLEISVGLIISWTVYIFSKKWKEENELVLNKQIERTQRRHDYAIKLIQFKISYASDVAPKSKIFKEIFLLDKDEQSGPINDEISTIEYTVDELDNVQNLVNLYSDDIDPEEMRLILGVSKFAQILRRDFNEDVRILAHDLELFETKCDNFFKKFPKKDWSGNQEEILD